MNITLLNGSHILHQDGEKSNITVIHVPLISKTKKFSDIASPNNANVKERYGDADDPPALWRQDGPYVDVFGNIPHSLKEERSGVAAYLPQDFAPEGCSAFYYVINERWVAHGVHHITDDGKSKWGVSLLDAGDEGVVDTIVSSISERILEGGNPKISVAVHKNEDVFLQLKDVLDGFGIDVVPFEELTINKKVKPLYQHRDFSIVMLTFAIAAFIAMVVSIFYWIVKIQELDGWEDKVQKAQENLTRSEKSSVLGFVSNPKELLNSMSNDIPYRPASLIDVAANIANKFGDLDSVEVGDEEYTLDRRAKRNRMRAETVIIRTVSKDDAGSYLVDYERVAKSIIQSDPWVKGIESTPSAEGVVKLDIEVFIK